MMLEGMEIILTLIILTKVYQFFSHDSWFN
jgi:hypothetical protein